MEEVKNGRKKTRDDVDDDDDAADSPIPIDRGWAWVVVAGCFGMHVLVVGGIKSFGVLFVELQQLYEVSARQLGIVHGLASVLMMALGPVSNALSVRYSCRTVVFAGGLLIGSGFVASACVPSFSWLYLTYSVLTGLGSALAYAPSVVMVGHHFTRRRALANGISVSGSAVGSFVLPNLMRHLLNQYGVRGALAIIGAVMFHVCLCAVLFRPFSSYKRKPKPEESLSSYTPNEEDPSAFSAQQEDDICRSPKEEMGTRSPKEEEPGPTEPGEESSDQFLLDAEEVRLSQSSPDLHPTEENMVTTLNTDRSPNPEKVDDTHESPDVRDQEDKELSPVPGKFEDIKRSPDLSSLEDKEVSPVQDKIEDCNRSPNLRRGEGHQQIAVGGLTEGSKEVPISSSTSSSTDTEGACITANSVRDSFEKKLARNASVNSMITHFGSLKLKTQHQERTGSFKLNFRQDSAKSKKTGSLKRRAFKGGRPILERHPSALWDARIPESLKQAIEEEKRREQSQRGESIEMSPLDKSSKQDTGESAILQRMDSAKEQGKKTSRRIGSFKAIDVANPIKFIQERKKLLLASNVRYMSESRDVGVTTPTLKANEKAPLKRFYSVEAGRQPSPYSQESFLHRRIRQISEADSWRSESSVFASAGDLALASLQNISESVNEGEDDAVSTISRSSGLKGILRLSARTVHRGETKKTSVPLFDLSLMVNPVFLVFFLSLTCMNFGYPNIFVMIPSFCQEVGLDKTTAAFMVSIIGLTDLVGRLFIGWFSDLRLFPRKYGFMSTLAVAGLLCTMLPRMKTFNGLVAFCCGFGFCGGCFIALIAVILVDFLGKERLASSFGLASVAMAVGIMAGPAIYGDIRDTAGSWDVAFVVSGLMSMAAASCIFIEPLAQHVLNRPTKTPQQLVQDEML